MKLLTTSQKKTQTDIPWMLQGSFKSYLI